MKLVFLDTRLAILYKTIILSSVLLICGEGFGAQATRKAAPSRSNAALPQNEIGQIAQAARAAYNKQDWEAAISGYEKLVKSAPSVAEYHLHLGIAYYSTGRPHDAVQPLRQALKLGPTSLPAHAYLAVSLGETGQCREAISYLKADLPRVKDPNLRRALGLSGVRCAVALNLTDGAVNFIRALNRDFPDDPEVLYRTVHVYSDLSTRASQELLFKAPSSYQVRELNAEALEMQGRWDDAAKEYRTILEQNPRLPGIHYRLGRLILSAPLTPGTKEEARKEFEQELKIDPGNAAAEFVLGKLASEPAELDEAIQHFSRAVKLDPGFGDAFLELGGALISARRAAEAVPVLETAVKLQPENPLTHYRLSIAYSRVGRKEEMQREAQVFKELSEKAQKATETIQKGVSGVPPDKPR